MDPSQQKAHQANQAWQKRDQPMQTETAIALWEEALTLRKDRTDLYVPLTRACGRAVRRTQDAAEKKFWAQEARDYGALAVEKNPTDPEARALYAEALGQWAQANKGVKSLKVVKQAVEQLQKAIELNPKYAFAHMLLAQFYEKSPGLLSIGDKKKALHHAKLAVEHGPQYAINHITLAEIYLARGQKQEARQELETALALKPPAAAIPETLADQEEAKKMLKDL